MAGWAVEKAKWILETDLAMVQKAKEEGVRIAAGTDTGCIEPGRNARELELLVEAGLTPMEAIMAATKHAADCRGIGDRLGTLEPDKLADILVLNIDPLENIIGLQDKTNVLKILQAVES